MATADARTDPTVTAFVDAINEGNRDAFFAVLTPDATMSDDGTDRNLTEWIDREVFNANGRMDVESIGDDGRSLIANYRNDKYGSMRTAWRFEVSDGRISRFEAGQA